MADDLGDEWWLSDRVDDDYKEQGSQVKESPENAKQEVSQDKGLDQQSKKQLKRKPQELGVEGTENKEQKKRKKKKKKNLSEHLASTADKPGTSDDLQVAMATYFHDKLSVVEMEELILDTDNFVDDNEGKEPVSDYLKRVMPDWTHLVKEYKKKKAANNSCIVLVLTSSAKRAVDLNREAGPFKGDCVTAKLFAKHMKMKDQEKFLASHRIQFAVGTPHRIISLIDAGAFTLSDTMLVILDWNWRDAKLRKFVDIPELKKDLFDLLRTHVVPAASQEKLKIGLL